MNNEFLVAQFQRLIGRFGAKAFDGEFVQLATREVLCMKPESLRRFVDVMIGSRPHSKPPLLAEFREAAAADQKREFEHTVRQAVNAFETRSMPEILARHGYTGCKTLMEAVEVQKLRNRIDRAGGGGC